MYGTVAKYSLKPDQEQAFVAELKRFEEAPPAGWVYTTVFQSSSNPSELWASVVFESEEAYKRNADSPEMDQQFRRMLEHLTGEPEWHDGHVIHEGMRRTDPA